MMQGRVKFFNVNKGFGFITATDGKEYFFHIKGVKDRQVLPDGKHVSFEVESKARGLEAVSVSPREADGNV